MAQLLTLKEEFDFNDQRVSNAFESKLFDLRAETPQTESEPINYELIRIGHRQKIIDLLSSYNVTTKSNIDDLSCDITSFEYIDFNSPISEEQAKELFLLLDHFIYHDAYFEPTIEIKNFDEHGADGVRRDLLKRDLVAEQISKNFSNHSDRFMDEYIKNVEIAEEERKNRKLTRHVLFEKTTNKVPYYLESRGQLIHYLIQKM